MPTGDQVKRVLDYFAGIKDPNIRSLKIAEHEARVKALDLTKTRPGVAEGPALTRRTVPTDQPVTPPPGPEFAVQRELGREGEFHDLSTYDRKDIEIDSDLQDKTHRAAVMLARMRAGRTDVVADAAGIERHSVAHGTYDESSYRILEDAAHNNGKQGQYVARMDPEVVSDLIHKEMIGARHANATSSMDDIAADLAAERRAVEEDYFSDTDLESTGPASPWFANQPVKVVVREEANGVVKVVRVDGPPSLASRKPPKEVRDRDMPVLVQTEDGKPLKAAPRIMVWEQGKVLRHYPAPGSKAFEGIKGRFTDPYYPGWYKEQPSTEEEALAAVETMFTPEFQAYHSNMQHEFAEDAMMGNPDGVWDTIQNWMRSPIVAKYEPLKIDRRIVPAGPGGEDVIVPTEIPSRSDRSAVVWQEERKKDMLNSQLEFYRRLLGGDTTALENMRHFANDSPYKLSLYGETDPALKDLPIVWFHTDQNFFNAGVDNFIAQFDEAGEIGLHIGPSLEQASELLPGDSSGTLALRAWDVAFKAFEMRVNTAKSFALSKLQMSEGRFVRLLKGAEDYGLKWEGTSNPVETMPLLEDKVAREIRKWAVEVYKESGVRPVHDDVLALNEMLVEAISARDLQKNGVLKTAMSSMVLRAKKPLILWDEHTFHPSRTAAKLLRMPAFDLYASDLQKIARKTYTHGTFTDILSQGEILIKGRVAEGPGRLGAADPAYTEFSEDSKTLRAIVEAAGFDHILYPNAIETRGLPSAIIWKPEHIKFTWAPYMKRNNSDPSYVFFPGIPLASEVAANKENNND